MKTIYKWHQEHVTNTTGPYLLKHVDFPELCQAHSHFCVDRNDKSARIFT